MKVGDLIIWDSNFGYELGIYVGDGVVYDSVCAHMLTGRECREASVNSYEVMLFTLNNYKLVVDKYHNTVTFNTRMKSHIRDIQSQVRLAATCDKYNL